MTEKADNTVPKQLRPHAWKPGQSGNPAGRPKGSRNKLSEDFFRDLANAWENSGLQALAAMIEERPGDFAKMVASLQSKESDVDLKGDMTLTEVVHRIVHDKPAD